MKKTAILGLALSFALASAPAPITAQEKMSEGEALIGALLALGIGVAIAQHGQNGWDENRYGKPFSPAPDVVCLPKPKRCYKNGHVSWRWTQRIFG